MYIYIYIYCLHCNHTLRALRSEGVNLHASNGIFLGRAYDRLRRRTKSLCAAKKGWLGGHFFRTRVRRVQGA